MTEREKENERRDVKKGGQRVRSKRIKKETM
jgi:hypothetical protein